MKRNPLIDIKSLISITPAQIMSYLKAKGWVQEKVIHSVSSVWLQKEFEIIVPLETSYKDYNARVVDALETLAIFEGRSLDTVLKDIKNALKDVIRIRAISPATSKGTIPLEDGLHLLESTRELISAAASSSVAPRANYPSRKSDKVIEFLKTIQLGQTEEGSFVVTISTDIPPMLGLPSSPHEQIPLEEPFERMVTLKLIESLDACKEASKNSQASGDIKPFELAIDKGVSANLCDAIAKINQSCGNEQVEISMAWALARPIQNNIPNTICFTQDLIPYIAEAARTFKETKPIEDFELKGIVIQLKSKERKKEGEIVVIGLVDGQQRKVSIKLTKTEYDIAIKAHETITPIRCFGELKKLKKGFALFKISHFSLTEFS